MTEKDLMIAWTNFKESAEMLNVALTEPERGVANFELLVEDASKIVPQLNSAYANFHKAVAAYKAKQEAEEKFKRQ